MKNKIITHFRIRKAKNVSVKGFDPVYYLGKYPDVAKAGIDPLQHYNLYGRKEGRFSSAAEEAKHPSVEGFDPAYYLNKYPDVAKANMSPFQHYMLYGRQEGRFSSAAEEAQNTPVKGFDPVYYLQKYPDVAKTDMSPLQHYKLYGRKEGRFSSAAEEAKNSPVKEFDPDYYLKKYPDVAKTDLSPLQHYNLYGRKEGRFSSAAEEAKNTPVKGFDPVYYLKKYPDVAKTEMSPLQHYNLYGRKEGRFSSLAEEIKTRNTITNEELEHVNRKFIVILTTHHTQFIANLLQKKLLDVGISSTILFEYADDSFHSNLFHIVICPQMFSMLPKYYFAFQLEQTVSNRWITDEYLECLLKSIAFFDYSKSNIAYFSNLGFNYKNIFYLPISIDNTLTRKQNVEYKYDVLFYGDPSSPRRKKLLEILHQKFNLKIVSEVFGDELYDYIRQAKIIVNLHYYENALLETTRLYECLSMGKTIVSERSSDQSEYPDLEELVDFVDANNVSELEERIEELLSSGRYTTQSERIANYYNDHFDWFTFYFYRILLAYDFITYEVFYETIGKRYPLKSDTVCLSLTETPSRRLNFLLNQKRAGVHHDLFEGLRHTIGWIGCGLSYKYLFNLAKDLGYKRITICEDDVVFNPKHQEKINTIKRYLAEQKQVDIFAGLIADLAPETKVTSVMIKDGLCFVSINKMVSTVYNIYSSRIFDIMIKWDEHDRQVTNTIDRYIEKRMEPNVITTLDFLVGHEEILSSSLWGTKNTSYTTLIQASSLRLYKKTIEYLCSKLL